MKIYNLEVLDDFKKKHAQTRKKINLWKIRIKENESENPNTFRNQFKFSNLSNRLIVFKDNQNYRIIACINFQRQSIQIMEILTHEEYNEVTIKDKYNCD